MVNLEWFRTFKAIYETSTLTGAAESLYIDQPRVSLHLSSLEAHVGYKLFDRSLRKMVSTERGKVLSNCIQEAVPKLEEAEQHFHKSTEKEKPTISIGMCFEIFQFTLESYLPTLPSNVIIKFGEYSVGRLYANRKHTVFLNPKTNYLFGEIKQIEAIF